MFRNCGISVDISVCLSPHFQIDTVSRCFGNERNALYQNKSWRQMISVTGESHYDVYYSQYMLTAIDKLCSS